MAPMTVAENIWIRREPKNRFGFVDHGEMHRKTADLFKRLNIDIDPDVKVGTLSVANRQMVEIAKAVSYKSDVLIMDEPTSALTEREVDHLFTIIRALKAQGKGIIYITHKMNELFEIADEVSVFRDGKYIATKSSKEVTRDDIIRMMVGREITQMFPKETVPIGDVVLSVKGLGLKGIFHDVSFDVRVGRNPRALPVWSARAAPTSRRPCSASRRPTQGTIELFGKKVRDRQPGDRDAPRHGVPDRGSQGYRLLPAARHPGEHADRRAAVGLCQERLRRAEAARPRCHGNQQCAAG